jgi:putative N6-adenine-specific DNA methylase
MSYSSSLFYPHSPISHLVLRYNSGLASIVEEELHFKRRLLALPTPLKILESYKTWLRLEVCSEEFLDLLPYLKCPTQAYLVVEEFSTRDLPRWYQKLSKIPWHQWIGSDEVELELEIHESRLFDQRKLKDSFFKALETAKKHQPFPKRTSTPSIIRIQGHQDHFVVSVSLVGQKMYQRSYKKNQTTARAPLRENLAAACFFQLLLEKKDFKNFIFDPMCGSGTLLNEAFNFFSPTKWKIRPSDIPCLKSVALKKAHPLKEQSYQLIGCEKDLKTFQDIVRLLPSEIDYKNLDYQEISSLDGHGYFLVNPPYGKRLALAIKPDPQMPPWQQIGRQLMEIKGILGGAVLFPIVTNSDRQEASLIFFHGGIEVGLFLF